MSSDLLQGFPSTLRERVRVGKLGAAPALLCHPEPVSSAPRAAPLLLWLHGRTVRKEIDSARFLRLTRAGFACLAIDLPGHGERLDPALQAPDALPQLLAAGVAELDEVLASLWASDWAPLIDRERLALGGMSAGGMIALRRLCDSHPFRCAVVESSCGDFQAAGGGRFPASQLEPFDPARHLAGWQAELPFLALHSERDEVCPLVGITRFVQALKSRYQAPERVTLQTWPETGAPKEHAGFGRKSHAARVALIEFLSASLGTVEGP
ncbi:MAG: alpha/beta fold hydrolase [Planctomycetes bacterium]|nr:alpha/beta fold hydrolase [Planctomycetota bacterium]